jgi:hypothetical protein
LSPVLARAVMLYRRREVLGLGMVLFVLVRGVVLFGG